MTGNRPQFNEINQLQEKALFDKLLAARKLVAHGPEQGRSLEAEVIAALREILPAEYGVGTGFVVYHGDQGPVLSSQLDVIIFDAVRGGPIGQVASCQVYPIEAVYAYVEVKSTLSVPAPGSRATPNSLQSCMKQNHGLRKIRKRMYWDIHQFGSPSTIDLISVTQFPAMRGFVVAFEPKGTEAGDPDSLAQSMSDYAKKYDAHLHGVLILGSAFLTTMAVDVAVARSKDFYHVKYTKQHSLTAFKMSLLKALGTFPRPHENWVPAWETYFELPQDWKVVTPTST